MVKLGWVGGWRELPRSRCRRARNGYAYKNLSRIGGGIYFVHA